MYIPEFWVGVVCTLAVEIAMVVVGAIVHSCKRRKPKEGNDK